MNDKRNLANRFEERQGFDITYCTAEMYYLFSIFFHCILCSQSITVIFYQPQIVFITECFYSPQVKWVS